MHLGEAIRARRKALHLTLADVASAIGTTRQTMHKYETGLVANIPYEKVTRIADVLQTTPAKLMGWDSLGIYAIANIEPPPSTVLRPRLGIIACGTPIMAQENIEEYDAVPSGIPCDFTLICKGDSMVNARIMDGDIAYIRQQEEVENGEIAAVLVEDEATLKRVFRQDGQLVLMPENPRYAPMVFSGERLKEVHILGKAVAFHSIIR